MSESAGAGAIASAQGTSTNAPQAPQGSPAQPTVSERHRVKVDGGEIELTLDELKRDYQLRQASNRRFQEASEMAKKAGPALEAFEALQKGDIAKAKKLLPPQQFRKAMEDYLIGELEYEALPEYEQRRMAAEKRAADLQAELDQIKESGSKEQQKRELAEAGMAVDNEIAEILQKMGKKPTPYLVGAIVDELIANLDAKGQPLSAEKAYQKSRARLDGQAADYLADLSDQDFIAKLPPQRIEAIRKHLLAQIRPQGQQRPQAQAQAQSFKREDSKPMSIDEAFAAREAQLKQHRRKA